ncbi:MAG: superoxide dismutase family protein, partial [Candidatus Eisenbacteria bacterium]
MNVRPLPLLASAALLAVLSGCSAGKASLPAVDAALSASATAAAPIAPTLGNECKGIVMFYEQRDGTMRIVADLEGLMPGQTHAMHVHEKGDCSSADGMSAGGHYNPEDHPHSLPPHEPRHAGDLGNVTADGQGKAHYELTVDDLTIRGARNP